MNPIESNGSTLHWTPLHARKQFRENRSMASVTNTSVYCLGHLQANVVIIPSALADDLSEFCRLNSASCPLLYRSKVGEVSAIPLAEDSDIRTDLNRYNVFKCSIDGSQETSIEWQLTEYPWNDMVTFYLGCSYSFQEVLLEGGVPIQNVAEDTDCSMFRTNIQCWSVGRFSCPGMVVSMRPINKDLVEKAVEITARYDAVHGAPIHIGDPAIIGVKDILKPDFGDLSHFNEDLVPVFWACGYTSVETVRLAKPEIAFSHSIPGTIFICDVTSKDYFKGRPPPHGDEQPKVITVQDDPYYASILGEKTLHRINQLEQVIQEDPGNRGIKYLYKTGELVKAALRVSHAQSIAIVTGFPCNQGHDPPDETDGPAGALTMAKACQALGKNVTLVASHYNAKLLKDCVVDCVNAGILQDGVNVEAFTPIQGESDEDSAMKFLYLGGVTKKPRFDVLVAIEAVGRTEQGNYKTMNTVDLSSCCKKSPVDELFVQAQLKGSISTIGIGDGGNEIGMGNVKDQVKQHIKNGEDIACNVTVNHLITAGVSNWGGWAVAMAVFMLQNCLLHSRYLRHGIGEHRVVQQTEVLNSVKQEEKILEFLVSYGVVDGIRGTPGMSVDGLDFNDAHVTKLKQMLSIVNC